MKIQNCKLILKSLLDTLKSCEKLSALNITEAYRDSKFQNPVTSNTATVSLYSSNINKSDEAVTVEKYIYAVNLYTSVRYTGQTCINIISEIADVLLQVNNGEVIRTCEISQVTYDNTARSFHAVLYLTLDFSTYEDISPAGDSVSNVNIDVNNKKIANCKTFNVKVKKSTYDIKVYNQAKPFDTVMIKTEYTIYLKRLVRSAADINIIDLTDFMLTISQYGTETIYTGCNVTACEEIMDNNRYTVENITITATGKGIKGG